MSEKDKEIPKAEYYDRFPEEVPTQADIDEVNKAALERDYNIAYNIGLNELGLDHPSAVHYAQKTVFGRVISEDVGPQSEIMANVAKMPLSSPLPAVVNQMQRTPTPVATSGNRMALKYPAGILAALIGGGALWELLDADPPRENAATR